MCCLFHFMFDVFSVVCVFFILCVVISVCFVSQYLCIEILLCVYYVGSVLGCVLRFIVCIVCGFLCCVFCFLWWV